MRINLVTPFAEKDEAKALGARWDAAKKCWYIVNVDDLTPFMRWIPHLEASENPKAAPLASLRATGAKTKSSTVSISSSAVPHCGCNVLPWEECEHSVLKR